jgi:hypothetical protein
MFQVLCFSHIGRFLLQGCFFVDGLFVSSPCCKPTPKIETTLGWPPALASDAVSVYVDRCQHREKLKEEESLGLEFHLTVSQTEISHSMHQMPQSHWISLDMDEGDYLQTSLESSIGDSGQ